VKIIVSIDAGDELVERLVNAIERLVTGEPQPRPTPPPRLEDTRPAVSISPGRFFRRSNGNDSPH
jgi:hypothetical protein